jgi:hypothetical protein
MTFLLSFYRQRFQTSDSTNIPALRYAPTTWANLILKATEEKMHDVVEHHFIGAVLEMRFRNISIPNHPAHAADRQTARAGDFTIAKTVYHVTATPSRNVIQKCAETIKAGLLPILLIPSEQEYRAKALAQDEGVDKDIAIISIESFVATNIIELATEKDGNLFDILQDIVQIYNRRLAEVETDLSLRIEVR